MSSQALFDDSSTSEVDDDEGRDGAVVVDEEAGDGNNEVLADSVPSKQSKGLDQPKRAHKEVKDGIDDYDDYEDDDEPEFDDAGAITGSSYLSRSQSDKLRNRQLTVSAASASSVNDTRPRRGEDEEDRVIDMMDRSGDELNNENTDSVVNKLQTCRQISWKVPGEALIRSLRYKKATNTNTAKQKEVWLTKLPNLVGIQAQPFDIGKYNAVEEEDVFGNASNNLIRWRINTSIPMSGNDTHSNNGMKKTELESNARLVEWEDGSFTLHLGSSEAFEVDMLSSSSGGDTASTVMGSSKAIITDPDTFSRNGYLFVSHKANEMKKSMEDSDTNNNDNHTNVIQTTVLECAAPITTRLTIRPSSLQSEAHKMHTVAVRNRTIQRAQISHIATSVDPEKQKQERIRNKTDLEKSTARASHLTNTDSGMSRRRFPTSSQSRRAYLEEEDDDRDYDTTNIRALKRGAYENNGFASNDPDGVDDDDDDESEHAGFMNRRSSGKGSKMLSQTELDSSNDDMELSRNAIDDDEDEESFTVKKTAKIQLNQSVFADDDSDSD